MTKTLTIIAAITLSLQAQAYTCKDIKGNEIPCQESSAPVYQNRPIIIIQRPGYTGRVSGYARPGSSVMPSSAYTPAAERTGSSYSRGGFGGYR